MTTEVDAGGHWRLPRVAAGFVALVCVAVLSLGIWREWMSRQTALQGAAVDVINLSRSLAQHAEDMFELADSLVIGFVHRLESEGTGPRALARLQAVIEMRRPTLGRIRGLFVYDAEGRWLATSEDVDLAAFNNSDRDYFRHHRGSPDKGPLLGKPIRSRSGGQWIITVSRRFNRPDGSFGGVVLATIDSAYFADFYRQFDIGPRGAVTLMDTNGIVLARSVDNEALIGSDLSSLPLFRQLGSPPDGQPHRFTLGLDDGPRVAAYERTRRFPALVLVTEAESDALSEWQGEAILRTVILLGLIALIAIIGVRLVRQLAERQRLAATLAAREADFRLLAEGSSDMVMRVGLDENIRYVSPSCERIVGWTAEQLIGTPALVGVNPEDLPRVREIVGSLKRGEIDETRMIYRTRHRLKGEIWLETAMHATHQREGSAVDGVVAISRDMTEHKHLERRLTELATLDGLTGLANRRTLDERLNEEWVRARRDGTPVSLLLIDVDHFKKYNDAYGHQAGDDCLKAVARVIAGEARRPADLAARYGGEEFALLLPGADATGCGTVGERIREELEALALPHRLNPPSRRVTTSLGGATGWPANDAEAEPASVIGTADNALYAAKHCGRDRLILAGQVVPWPGAESA